MVDPTDGNTLYSGAATGGVWKSTDGGQSWRATTDKLAALAVNSLAIDPTSPGTIYAGTGEQIPGAGVFKTTDGAQTWSQLPATASAGWVYSLAISPTRPSQIYAGMDNGLWASMDGGMTWNNTLREPGGCFSVVARGDQSSDIVFASCSSQPAHLTPFGFSEDTTSGYNIAPFTVYQSVDAGGHWSPVLGQQFMGPTALAIAPSAPNTVYALAVNNNTSSPFANALLGVFASDQGGAAGTWSQRADTSSATSITANILSYPAYNGTCGYASGHAGQGAWNLGIAVDPVNPQVVFTAGRQLARSDDGGRTFAGVMTTRTNSILFPTDFHAFAFDPNYDGASNQIIYVTSDDGVYRSDMARASANSPQCGEVFYELSGSAINNGLQVGQFYHGAIAPGGSYYLGGTQDTVTLFATPGQTDWRPLADGDGGMVAIDPSNPKTYYFENTVTALPFMKVNNGAPPVQSISGITENPDNFNFLSFFTLDPSASQTIYLGGHGLWYSTNGAALWQQGGADTGVEITSIAVNPSDSGQVIYGNVNGAIFNGSGRLSRAPSISLPRLGYVSGIVFDANQPGVIYATYATFRMSAGDSQIYRSIDGGNSWSAIGASSLPDIPAHALVVDPDNSNTLYLGTDIGLFVSLDSGATWTRDAGFPNVITQTLALDFEAGVKTLYAFTYGRGAFRVGLAGRSLGHR